MSTDRDTVKLSALTRRLNVEVTPLLDADGYDSLPVTVRESLGGISHAEHLKAVDAIFSRNNTADVDTKIVKVSTSELLEIAAALEVEISQPLLDAVTITNLYEAGASDDYANVTEAYDEIHEHVEGSAPSKLGWV